MTGYGKAEAVLETGKLTIEIKTLNGKNSDANIKSSLLPKDKELLVRRKITDSLVRGTIDFYITWEPKAGGMAKQINKELLREYYDQLMDFSASLPVFDSLSFNPNEMLASILRFPDVMDNSRQDIITEENWPVVEKAIDEAIAAVNDYRAKEGEALYRDVTSRVRNILDLENQVEGFEKERIDAVREKLMKNLETLQQKVDPSRFEQEMIFYLEKLDINEEKVRLRQHCKYFVDTIDGEEYPGRKLGFIIQEMGREINTTGSTGELRYTDEHVWVRMEGDEAVIGISDFAQDQLGEIAFVDLPAVGVRFDAGSDFGTVESLKSVNQLYMPIPGEVVAVNEELESTPTLVNVSPYGEGWMIRIRPDASAESLLDAAGYRALLGL